MSLRKANKVARDVIEAAFYVHMRLGTDKDLQSYESAMAYELSKRELTHKRQEVFFIKDRDGKQCKNRFIIVDFLVEDLVIVTLSNRGAKDPSERKVMRSYLRLTEKKVGIKIDFMTRDFRKAVLRWDASIPVETDY